MRKTTLDNASKNSSPRDISELRTLARSSLHDGGRNTVLDTTALVHKAQLLLGAMLKA